MWGGPGIGLPCAVCDLPVKTDEPEFEIEFASAGDPTTTEAVHFHVRCFTAWEFERTKV